MASGRLTDYNPKYCKMLIEYFDINPYKRIKLKYYYKNGESKDIIKDIPVDLPTFEGFCSKIGICKQTLHNWKNRYPLFLDAYERAKMLQKNILIQNGLANRYNCLFAKFVAINATDMVEKQNIEYSGEIKTKIDSEDKESIKKELLDILKKELDV